MVKRPSTARSRPAEGGEPEATSLRVDGQDHEQRGGTIEAVKPPAWIEHWASHFSRLTARAIWLPTDAAAGPPKLTCRVRFILTCWREQAACVTVG
jgi:hypothetical protein